MTENTTAGGAADTISGASEAILEQLEDALVEWSGYVTADDAPRTLREHASPHIKMLRAELGRLHALAAAAPVAPTPATPDFDLSTSAGGRGYVAWYFEHRLLPRERHDFRSYINGALAADFACALARHLSAAARAATPEAAPVAPAVGNSGFDYKTAADLLNGKTVRDEAIRKFVAASRWAHDDRAGLVATLLSARGELASREAEIALLKKTLVDAEPAPQPAPLQQGEYPETLYEGGRESVDDALAVVESFGPGVQGLNDTFARQVLLGQEVRRLRTAYEHACQGRSDFRNLYRAARGAAQAAPAPVAEDAANWHWLASYLVGPRTDLDDEIVASESVNDLRKLVSAARARAQAAQPEGGA